MPRLLLLLLSCLLPLSAAAERYRLDPVHTRVLFAIEHAGFSQALGTVSGSEGVLAFDPETLERRPDRDRPPLPLLRPGATEGYEASVSNLARTSLQTDMVFADSYESELGTTTGSVDAGYSVTLPVGI